MRGLAVVLLREWERFKDPVRLAMVVAFWVGPLVLGVLVLRMELSNFASLDEFGRGKALEEGVARSWVNIQFVVYVFVLPLAASLLAAESLAAEYGDGSALVWRSWPLRDREVLVGKYLALWLVVVLPILASYGAYLALVRAWAPIYEGSWALAHLRSLAFLGSYYALLGLVISSWSPQPSMAAILGILAGYDYILVPLALRGEASQGLYFEYYWGKLTVSWLGTESVPEVELQKAVAVIVGVAVTLAAALAVGLRLRSPR